MKRFDPAAHLTRQQRRVGVGVLRDCAINYPMVAGLKNQTDTLFRQLTERSVDGSVKRIKHRWLSYPLEQSAKRHVARVLRGVNGNLR
jgi:hypothetical protein